jgi:heptosyltransferase-3
MTPDAKVLAIIVARIGDTLLVTPALRALKAELPSGRLSIMAHPKRLEVLQNLPFIDDINGITKTSAHAKGWVSANKYDYVLVWGHDHALMKYALRVGNQVIAFRQGNPTIDGKLAHAVPEPTEALHAVIHRAALLAPLKIMPGNLRLAYAVTDAERAQAKTWLLKCAPGDRKTFPGRPLIGLQIASFPTKAHRDWPLEHFAALIRNIVQSNKEARFVLLGDAATALKAAPLLPLHPGGIVVAAGKLSLRESAALMSELDLYIGVDTGPTHIAGALGIPMVAMYHSAYPGRNLAPLQNPHCTVIEHPATGNRSAVTESMADISVETVWRAVQERLIA